MTRYEELGYVRRRKSQGSKPIPLIAISPDCAPHFDAGTQKFEPRGKLWEFLEHLNSFRREGKDRRDAGDVVGEAVLRVLRQNTPAPVETTQERTSSHM